jgi:hypothetical protein
MFGPRKIWQPWCRYMLWSLNFWTCKSPHCQITNDNKSDISEAFPKISDASCDQSNVQLSFAHFEWASHGLLAYQISYHIHIKYIMYISNIISYSYQISYNICTYQISYHICTYQISYLICTYQIAYICMYISNSISYMYISNIEHIKSIKNALVFAKA